MNRPWAKGQTTSGFTLIETIIALVVSMIAVSALGFIYRQTVLDSTSPPTIVQASFLGQERMEEVLYYYGRDGFDFDALTPFNDETPLGGDYATFNRRVTIGADDRGECTAPSPLECKLITVIVSKASDDSTVVTTWTTVTDIGP